MVRLILEENGAQRAFKLNDGKLSIGSGADCALTLSSDDVAEFHAELELQGDVAILIPRPGVTPPKVLGRPITKATRLPKSAEFRIGSAIFRLQPEGQAVAASGARTGTARTPAAGRGPRVQRQRRKIKRDLPTWMILGILAVIGVVGYFVGQAYIDDGEVQYDPGSRYLAAYEAYSKGALKRAKMELERIDMERAPADLKAKIETLRENVALRDAEAKTAAWNVGGTKWMETQLKGYERKNLQGGGVTRAKARLFIKRCDEFRKKYPQHPELGWVERFRKRWAEKAELSEPNDIEDVTWEVFMLTGGKPRDYATVFSLLNDLLTRAEGADRDAALELLDKQKAEREEYAIDRMQQSRYNWNKGQYGAAVEDLVQLITKIGDDSLRDQATSALLKMTNQEGVPLTSLFLSTYQRDRPWQFEDLLKDPRIKAAAKEEGLL